jgi:hypothetical protein
MSAEMPIPATFPSLLQEHHQALSGQPWRGLACSVLVARALRRSKGLDDTSAYAEVWKIDGRPSWWQLAQIGDPARPWSGVEAAVALGGRLLVEAPERPGWYKVQVWTTVQGAVVLPGSRGHDFFVQLRRDGSQVIWESDEGRGFRRREMTLEARIAEHSRIFGAPCDHHVVALWR